MDTITIFDRFSALGTRSRLLDGRELTALPIADGELELAIV